MEPSTSNGTEVKKENDEDSILVNTGETSPSRKRRSNSVIDSVGSGVAAAVIAAAGESFFAYPVDDAVLQNNSPSASSDTSLSESQSIVTTDSAKVQSELVKRVADKVDAHVKIIDDAENNSECATFTALMPVEKDAACYNMNHKYRGKCVIFNHEEFEIAGFDKREGSTKDATKLQKTFSSLGFDTKTYDNLSHKEVTDVLEDLSSNTDHTDNDCICVIVLTHGLQNDLISAKDVIYKTDMIWKPFTADKCPSLAGKPKLFFIQACRGEAVENSVVLTPHSTVSSTDSVSSYKIPTHADILIAHSSAQGFYTWRDPQHGTWYVGCLCEILDKHGTELDLLTMLTMTSRKVATDYSSYNPQDPTRHAKKQVPSFTSLLLRAVYFPLKTNV
ncbi:PREDICTED: caspase-1-like [Dinoponera quadriceps]|uniref:Caspase-1-like n=1 Tax=Dinoponera quadriceps TaxID=609295 RepID=A0A6P3WXW4_DINQU|nr:PREDICTED: caspase-1-like [Dinoponera quadriceps]